MLFLSPADVAAALHGLFRLVRFDKEGLEYFDASVEGFIKSFWVAAVLLPPYLLIMVFADVALSEGPTLAPQLARYVIVEALAYVVDWVAFPLVLLTLADYLGVNARVLHFLVPFNWFQLIIVLAFLPLDLLIALGLLPDGLIAIVSLGLIGGWLAYTTFQARHGLQVPWWSAFGVTGLSITVGVVVLGWAGTLKAT